MKADPTQTAAFARVRSALSGRYHIEGELGVGGMATVEIPSMGQALAPLSSGTWPGSLGLGLCGDRAPSLVRQAPRSESHDERDRGGGYGAGRSADGG
jgi:hypothetical protein